MIDISNYSKKKLQYLISEIIERGFDYVIRGKFLIVYRLDIG